ncbi:MAG: hypothetical protein DVB25_04045 [Verrucomicrobia bacterium]|nr:MAG: hypothetical protein DVB25_04045 [Verrucomicrobiota bacterium]
MKTPPFTAVAASAMAIAALASPQALAQSTNPSIPFGTLSASPTIVQTGTKPNLTWNITYPSSAKDYVTVTPTGGITANRNLICDIRILGAGVTTPNSNGTINYIETAGKIRYNSSSSWTTIFDGRQTDAIVQKQGIVKTLNVTAGMAMDFGGQYFYNGSWFTFFNSTNGTNVRSLVNGDACPSYVPAYNAPSLATFLKPYLDSSNKVRIGPMDVVIFMELTHTDKTNPGYDFQDLVLLITLRTS